MVLEHSMSIFWTSICTSVTNGFEAGRRVGSRVVRVHLQVQPDGAAVCRHENWARGRLLEVEVCSPQLFFHSLPWEVRRWSDKLLTTLRNPPLHNPPPHPTPTPLCHRGAALMGGKASHRLTSPCFWTSLTVPASLLPAQHLAFKFSPPPPPPHRSHLLSCQSGSVLWGLFIYNSGGLKHTRNVKISTSGDFDEICLLVFAGFIKV